MSYKKSVDSLVKNGYVDVPTAGNSKSFFTLKQVVVDNYGGKSFAHLEYRIKWLPF